MTNVPSGCAVLDIGSTYTKGVIVDASRGEWLARTQVPTTADRDVRIGVQNCLRELIDAAKAPPREVFASSSAQGGLGVVAVGLVPSLTLQAAQEVALGAGAKVLRSFGYHLTRQDLQAVWEEHPDIILLCGGIDGGDEGSLVGNANALAGQVDPEGTIIVAGNRFASDQAAEVLRAAGWDAQVVPNVLPDIDTLNTEPAREAIRQVFLEKITQAKGISLAEEQLDGPLVPTPAAVLRSAELLTGRCGIQGPLKKVMLIDVGGATTDVVSVADDSDRDPSLVQVGLRAPTVKRTVEGDLGMRWNARTIVNRFDLHDEMAYLSLPDYSVEELLCLYREQPNALASDNMAERFDGLLLRTAIREASLRHCGTVEEIRVPHAPSAFRLRGKDLRSVELVVGTGGMLNHRPDAIGCLRSACSDPSRPDSLRPHDPKYAIDSDYALFACGILADRYPEAGLRLAMRSLRID